MERSLPMRTRAGRTALKLLLVAAFPVLAAGVGTAAVIDLQSETGFKVVPKDGIVLIAKATKAKGEAHTNYAFHPILADSGELKKDLAKKQVTPAVVKSDYVKNGGGPERHGTTGSAEHRVALSELKVNTPKGMVSVPVLTDSVTASIQPGKNEDPAKVSILAALFDPLVFSDISPDAQFPFTSAGLDLRFSLLAGTAFPAVFAPDSVSFGAVAEETSIKLRLRVAPGSISDPGLFWSDGLAGAIDLFTLVLTADKGHHVDATLLPGASTSAFTLSFDGFGSAESLIEGAFDVTGRLPASLEDLFTVGFVPGATVTQYTVGFAREALLTANEVVPEPSTLALLLACAGVLLLRRRTQATDAA